MRGFNLPLENPFLETSPIIEHFLGTFPVQVPLLGRILRPHLRLSSSKPPSFSSSHAWGLLSIGAEGHWGQKPLASIILLLLILVLFSTVSPSICSSINASIFLSKIIPFSVRCLNQNNRLLMWIAHFSHQLGVPGIWSRRRILPSVRSPRNTSLA